MVVQVWTPTPLGAPATQRTREPKSHPRATFKRRLRESLLPLVRRCMEMENTLVLLQHGKAKNAAGEQEKERAQEISQLFHVAGRWVHFTGGEKFKHCSRQRPWEFQLLWSTRNRHCIRPKDIFRSKINICPGHFGDSGLPTFTCYQKIRNQFKRLPNSPRLIFPLGWHNTIRGLFLQLAVHFSDFSSI